MRIEIKTEKEFRDGNVRLAIEATPDEAAELSRRILAPRPEIALDADRLLELTNRAGAADDLAAQLDALRGANIGLQRQLGSVSRDLAQAEKELTDARKDRDGFQDLAASRFQRINELQGTVELNLAKTISGRKEMQRDAAELRGQLDQKTAEIDALIKERDQWHLTANERKTDRDNLAAEVRRLEDRLSMIRRVVDTREVAESINSMSLTLSEAGLRAVKTVREILLPEGTDSSGE